jgi:hypothetical protein
MRFIRKHLLRREMHEASSWDTGRDQLDAMWKETFADDPWPTAEKIRGLLIPTEILPGSAISDLDDIIELSRISQAFVSAQGWVQEIGGSTFYRGFSYLAVFLHEVVGTKGEAGKAWSIVGNGPPYIIIDDGVMTGAEALEIYVAWLRSWLGALGGNAPTPSFPLLTQGGAARLDDPKKWLPSLERLVAVVESKVLPRYRQLDQDGVPADQEHLQTE